MNPVPFLCSMGYWSSQECAEGEIQWKFSWVSSWAFRNPEGKRERKLRTSGDAAFLFCHAFSLLGQWQRHWALTALQEQSSACMSPALCLWKSGHRNIKWAAQWLLRFPATWRMVMSELYPQQSFSPWILPTADLVVWLFLSVLKTLCGVIEKWRKVCDFFVKNSAFGVPHSLLSAQSLVQLWWVQLLLEEKPRVIGAFQV